MKIIITVDVGAVPEGAGMVKVAEVEQYIKELSDPSLMMTHGYRSVSITYEA